MTAWGIHGERIFVLVSLGGFMLVTTVRAWRKAARTTRQAQAMVARWERERRVQR